ncbi:MAG TPA: glycosyltransferase [Pseudonocardiaceae bacterium]|nr:glycosyltransferase [Pseudonocardiaceae bacterium]
MTTVAVLSFRLGVADGVSVAAAQWVDALQQMGYRVRTIAGAGTADRLVPGLALDSHYPAHPEEMTRALHGADLVVVENVCSLPMNPAVTEAVAQALRGRRAVLRHHDLPWEREQYAHLRGWPPDDPSWLHVAISRHSATQLARRGIAATTMYPGYARVPPHGDRSVSRAALRVAPRQRLLLQPTRAIPRKNIAAGLALAQALDAVYWLTGAAEDGYGPQLDELLNRARCPVRRGLPGGLRMADAYAAADAVVLPSTWEGFGMPLIESALAGRPLAVNGYPVAQEVATLGFTWFPTDDPAPLAAWFADPDPALLARNRALARHHFGPDALARRLTETLARAGLPLPHAR